MPTWYIETKFAPIENYSISPPCLCCFIKFKQNRRSNLRAKQLSRKNGSKYVIVINIKATSKTSQVSEQTSKIPKYPNTLFKNFYQTVLPTLLLLTRQMETRNSTQYPGSEFLIT